MFKIKTVGGSITRSSNIDIVIDELEVNDTTISLLDAIKMSKINDILNTPKDYNIQYGKLYTIFGGIKNITIKNYDDILELFKDDKYKYDEIKKIFDKYSNTEFNSNNAELLREILKKYESIINT